MRANRWMQAGTLGLMVTCAVSLATLPASAEEQVWVSADATTHHSLGHGAAMFIEGGDVFDLSDLRDGETRVFGVGTKQVTVTREGDVATIVRAKRGDDDVKVTCVLGQDTCQVVTLDEDPNQVMIMVEKSRVCINGVGDCDGDGTRKGTRVLLEDIGAFGPGHVVVKEVHCDDDGDCDQLEDVMVNVDAHTWTGTTDDANNVFVLHEDGPGMLKILTHGEPGGNAKLRELNALLRCPEGDTRMHVKREEVDDVFLCPKHSVPLEKVEHPQHRMRIKKLHRQDGTSR